MGLNLVQTLVELLGGTVGIVDGPSAECDRALYTGATFSVFIPDPDPKEIGIGKPDAAAEESAAETAPTPLASERPVLLVVEDNPDMLTFLSEFLGSEYTVRQAVNGEQALGLLAENDVDLVVSDIMMPGINGIELCRRIKDDVNTSHIPVVLLSAKTDAGSKIEGLEYGADAYIEKPFSPEASERRQICQSVPKAAPAARRLLQDASVADPLDGPEPPRRGVPRRLPQGRGGQHEQFESVGRFPGGRDGAEPDGHLQKS